MSRTIWTKFYWQDWLADAGLRRCSLAARGLWIDLLCIAAQHDPIGYVAIGGKGLSATDIARMAGASEPEVSTLLDELAENGVFSRDRIGRIYSRRMLRDAKKARTAQINGQKGGNPTLGNNKQIPASDNPPDNVKVNGQDKPYKLEAISQEEKNRELRSLERLPKDDGWPEGFFRIWYAAYPRHKDPAKAEARLISIRKNGKVSWSVLMAGTERYAAECAGKDPQYVKHPTTWLNAGSWANEPDRDYRPTAPANGFGPQANSIVDAGRRRLARLADAARGTAGGNGDFFEASPANDGRREEPGGDRFGEGFGTRDKDLDLSARVFPSPSLFV